MEETGSVIHPIAQPSSSIPETKPVLTPKQEELSEKVDQVAENQGIKPPDQVIGKHTEIPGSVSGTSLEKINEALLTSENPINPIEQAPEKIVQNVKEEKKQDTTIGTSTQPLKTENKPIPKELKGSPEFEEKHSLLNNILEKLQKGDRLSLNSGKLEVKGPKTGFEKLSITGKSTEPAAAAQFLDDFAELAKNVKTEDDYKLLKNMHDAIKRNDWLIKTAGHPMIVEKSEPGMQRATVQALKNCHPNNASSEYVNTLYKDLVNTGLRHPTTFQKNIPENEQFRVDLIQGYNKTKDMQGVDGGKLEELLVATGCKYNGDSASLLKNQKLLDVCKANYSRDVSEVFVLIDSLSEIPQLGTDKSKLNTAYNNIIANHLTDNVPNTVNVYGEARSKLIKLIKDFMEDTKPKTQEEVNNLNDAIMKSVITASGFSQKLTNQFNYGLKGG